MRYWSRFDVNIVESVTELRVVLVVSEFLGIMFFIFNIILNCFGGKCLIN